MGGDSDGEEDESDSTVSNYQIPYMFAHFNREGVEIVGDEPFEHP